MPESRQLLRAHAGLTARTFQNIIDHIDFGDFVGVSQPDAADFAIPQQVIGCMAADAQHGLQILDRYNVRVLRKHELVHFSDFFTIHSITILEFQLSHICDANVGCCAFMRMSMVFAKLLLFSCAFMLWCGTIRKILQRE